MDIKNIKTLGALKKSEYTPKSIKDEIRSNLSRQIKNGERLFDHIYGFENTVLPDIERAFLSRHNILLLGLRGQAKTKIARLSTQFLDEYIPVIKGSELNDDPLNPISRTSVEIIQDMGDETPVEWVHRDDRYVEKLATPDVSVADLIGDVDPIKAATLKLPYSDQRVIHYGLIPRAHRSIFVLNELPDLQPRIQVSLFNILQEGDIQIRGFKLRLPLDILFIFTANPEDYTNRGSIITPLKDRIESQILTHYPTSIQVAKQITEDEADIHPDVREKIHIPELVKDLLETIVFKARHSEYTDEKSGVSARMGISAMENLYSAIERRMLINGETRGTARINDFWGVIPSMTGKVELVYEGEQEGPYNVALLLISAAISDLFTDNFPNPDKTEKMETKDPYGVIKTWFSAGNGLSLLNDASDKEYRKELESVPGLKKFVENYGIPENEQALYMEFILHGLTEFEVISKEIMSTSMNFKDPIAGMFRDLND